MSETKPTRAQVQADIDLRYAFGVIDQDEWRRRTDELSSTTKWNAEGIIPPDDQRKN